MHGRDGAAVCCMSDGSRHNKAIALSVVLCMSQNDILVEQAAGGVTERANYSNGKGNLRGEFACACRRRFDISTMIESEPSAGDNWVECDQFGSGGLRVGLPKASHQWFGWPLEVVNCLDDSANVVRSFYFL